MRCPFTCLLVLILSVCASLWAQAAPPDTAPTAPAAKWVLARQWHGSAPQTQASLSGDTRAEAPAATLRSAWSNPPTPLGAGENLTLAFRRTLAMAREQVAGRTSAAAWVLEFAAMAVCGPDGTFGRLTRAATVKSPSDEETVYTWRMPQQEAEGQTLLVLAGVRTPAGRKVTDCWLYQPENRPGRTTLPDLAKIGTSLALGPREHRAASEESPTSVALATPAIAPCAVPVAPEPPPVSLSTPVYRHPQAAWQVAPGEGWAVQPAADNDTLVNPTENLRVVIWRQSIPFAGGAFPVLEKEINSWRALYPEVKPQYVELNTLPAMQCALPGHDGWLLSFCVGKRLYRAWGLPMMAGGQPLDCALPLKVMQTLQVAQ